MHRRHHQDPGQTMGRLFIVGCPRSGTTALQAAVSGLPGVFTLPETGWFTQLLGGVTEWVQKDDTYTAARWRRRLAWASPRVHRRLQATLATLAANGEPAPRLPWRLRGRSYIGDLVRLLDQAAARRGCSHWLEKTPDHLIYIDIISRYVPGARFIHLIRNCEDVLASAIDGQIRYAEQHTFLGSIGLWAARWNRTAETHLHYAGRDGHLVLRYEDFVAAPEVTLGRIRAFAGIEASGKAAGARISNLGTEPWKRESLTAPVRPQRRKFEELFGPLLQRWLRENLLDYDAVCAELRRRQVQPPETIAAVPGAANDPAGSFAAARAAPQAL